MNCKHIFLWILLRSITSLFVSSSDNSYSSPQLTSPSTVSSESSLSKSSPSNSPLSPVTVVSDSRSSGYVDPLASSFRSIDLSSYHSGRPQDVREEGWHSGRQKDDQIRKRFSHDLSPSPQTSAIRDTPRDRVNSSWRPW